VLLHMYALSDMLLAGTAERSIVFTRLRQCAQPTNTSQPSKRHLDRFSRFALPIHWGQCARHLIHGSLGTWAHKSVPQTASRSVQLFLDNPPLASANEWFSCIPPERRCAPAANTWFFGRIRIRRANNGMTTYIYRRFIPTTTFFSYRQHCAQRKAPVFKLLSLSFFRPVGCTRCTDGVKFGSEDALAVKIWTDLLKGLRSCRGFKLRESGPPNIQRP